MTTTPAQLQKTWTITPNVRLTPFVSLVATMGWWAYQNHAALVAKWSVWWTCDGTTGPANAADHTDRITDATKFQTRATIAGAAQSYAVYKNADGVMVLITYQGASDDICRISYSPGGLFTLAGTTTQQPTATDEVVLSTGNSVINATTSADRVQTIWATTTDWCNACYRSNALAGAVIGVEKITPIADSSVFNPTYVGYRYTDTSKTSLNRGCPVGGSSATAVGAAGWTGTVARVFTGGSSRTPRICGGEIAMQSTIAGSPATGNVFTANQPSFQNGTSMPLLPIFWSGENGANLDGFLGAPIDWWQGVSASLSIPAAGDFFPGLDPADAINATPRSNWMVALGAGMVRPWRNAAASLLTA